MEGLGASVRAVDRKVSSGASPTSLFSAYGTTEQLAKKVDVGTEGKKDHPSAVKTAAVPNDLPARINPGPFKTFSCAVFQQAVKSCSFKASRQSAIAKAFGVVLIGAASKIHEEFMRLSLKALLPGLFVAATLVSYGTAAHAQDSLKSVLDRLDASAANFHSASADVEFDNNTTDPVPDTDVQKGVVYYDRKSNAVRMGVHMSEHNGKPSGKAYTFIGGQFKLFEPGPNQVTTFKNAGKYESYVILGMGASGKDIAAKWDIKDLGPETIDGTKTEKLELVAKDPAVQKNLSKVTIWIDPDHAVSLKQIFTTSPTSSYVATYKNFKFNASLPSDAFTFKTNHNTTESHAIALRDVLSYTLDPRASI